MNLVEYISGETLLIIPNNIKSKVLDYFNNVSNIMNVKIMSLEEVKKHIYFDYDIEAKLFVMDNYNLKSDIVSVILDNLYLIENRSYSDYKLSFLKKVKQMLDENNLLLYDDLFLEFIKNKNIIVYGYSKIDKFSMNMLEKINAKIIDVDTSFKQNDVYLLNTLEDEVEFVFDKISKLINDGVDINKIKLVNVSYKYLYTIKRFSNIFSIPVYVNDNSIYSTIIVKEYLNKLNSTSDFSKTLEYLKETFDLSKEANYSIYNMLFDISNKYNDLEYSFSNIYELVLEDIKKSKLPEKKLLNKIEITSLEDNLFDEEYVFLLNFNQGEIPKFYKDEDYLSDSLKESNDLCCDKTIEKNILSKQSVITSINRISNIIITAKEKSIDSDYMISNLVSELNYNLIKVKFNYLESFSNKNLKIKLAKYLDQFIKYGVIDDNLNLLYSNIDINYLTYSNKFTGIDNKLLLESILPKLTLSYTQIDNYYHCAFKYYLSNILKIDKFEENFNTIIGSLFHYILSICFNGGFDFEVEYDNYISKLTLNKKEEFFLTKLKNELFLVIDQVKKLHNDTGLTKLLLEHKIKIDKSSIIPVEMVGIVDKIMYKEKENTLVSIVDYKTGKNDIDLYNVIYGLSMQLPIYLYLVKNSNLFSNVRFTGFYLQRILSSEVNFTLGKTYKEQKQSNLKLEGYSNSDPSILEVFIPDYEDSKFVKSMKTTQKGFYHYAKVLDDDKINNLILQIDKKIEEARDNILLGNFDINPKQIGVEKVGCDFCKFKDICYRTNNDFKRLPVNKLLNFLGGDEDA